MINETDKLAQILSNNDEVTAFFVTGLVFAYVICLSLPVIFVTACSLYIKRHYFKNEHKNDGKGKYQKNQRKNRIPKFSPTKSATRAATGKNCYYDSSPIGQRRQPTGFMVGIGPWSESQQQFISPSLPSATSSPGKRRTALIRFDDDCQRTVIPLNSLIDSAEMLEIANYNHTTANINNNNNNNNNVDPSGMMMMEQRLVTLEFQALYDPLPPPSVFADSMPHTPKQTVRPFNGPNTDPNKTYYVVESAFLSTV